MNRRKFLKTVSTALACGPMLGKAIAADMTAEQFGSALTQDEESFGPSIKGAAAIFPSKLWESSVKLMNFDEDRLPEIDSFYSNMAPININEGRFVFDADNVPNVVIAVASPLDPDSWRAAQAQCAIAKRAGVALTLLFAAHTYPEVEAPFFSRTLLYEHEYGCMEGMDTVIDFVTLDPRQAFPRMVNVLTHCGTYLVGVDTATIGIELEELPCFCGNPPRKYFENGYLKMGLDVAGLREILGGGQRAMYLSHTAHHQASTIKWIWNQLRSSTFVRFRFDGGLVLTEGADSFNRELLDAASILRDFLPERAPLSFGVGQPYVSDPRSTVHAIMTYTTL